MEIHRKSQDVLLRGHSLLSFVIIITFKLIQSCDILSFCKFLYLCNLPKEIPNAQYHANGAYQNYPSETSKNQWSLHLIISPFPIQTNASFHMCKRGASLRHRRYPKLPSIFNPDAIGVGFGVQSFYHCYCTTVAAFLRGNDRTGFVQH